MDDVGQWTFPYDLEPSQEIKTKMMGKELQLVVRSCWKLHTYEFGGKVYRQSEEGPIGLRITMACARVIIINWGKIAKDRLEQSGIKVLVESCYVDDGRHLLSTLVPGSCYNKETQTVELSKEDAKDDRGEEERTREEVILTLT